MYPSLVLSAALLAPAAPLPRDATPNATGPAPKVLSLKADASGSVRVIGTIPVKQTVTNTYFVMEGNQQVQKNVEQDIVTTQYLNKTLADFNGKFATAEGTALTLDEATARVKGGATVLASADGKPIGKAWLQSVAADTVVMTAEGLSHAQIQWGGPPYPTTPAPRLTMLSTDAKGTVMAQTTSHPANGDVGVYYDEMQFEGRAIRGGKRLGGYGYYGGVPADAKVVAKPLADLKFDAYDLTGKLIHKSEVMKRLAAGGMVIVAGDNRLPDEAYLKGFHPDLIVLVGSELVLPTPPIDQTKKKPEPVKELNDPKAPAVAPFPPALLPPAAKPVAPVAPAVQPLPAIRPGIIKQPAIIRGNAIAPVQLPAVDPPAPAPAVEKK